MLETSKQQLYNFFEHCGISSYAMFCTYKGETEILSIGGLWSVQLGRQWTKRITEKHPNDILWYRNHNKTMGHSTKGTSPQLQLDLFIDDL